MSAKAALELVNPDNPPADEPEQLDLIGAVKPEKFRELQERRGPGRPPGARNKRTQEWAEYLLSRYASPLEVLMQIANARVDDLRKAIGCTSLEALQEKRLAAIAVIPYVHQKQPMAVDLTKTSFVQLIIQESEPAQVGDDLTLTARVVEAVKNDDSET